MIAECRQMSFRVGDVDIQLRIEAEHRIILGRILKRKAGHPLAGVPVTLLQDDCQIEMTITDVLGEFRFVVAPTGKLQVRADLPACRLIGDFTIMEAEFDRVH